MDIKNFNAPKILKLKELRKQLPARCDFGVIVSQRLEKEGVTVSQSHIYQMVRGQRAVHEKVLEQMQKLVNEMNQFEVSV